MQTPSWRLSVLGPGRLTDPAGRAARCEGKPLALITYLALEGPTTRARLADLLWPGVQEVTARNNLVVLMRRLRRQLGTDLIQADERLSLHPDLWVDAQALTALQVASDESVLPSGALLDGQAWEDLPEFADWLLVWRERLDAGRARLALQVAERHEAAGHWRPALTAIERALEWNALSEDLLRAHMRLLYLSGDRTGALRAFETGRARLRRELHTEPMPVTQDLARLIERGGRVPLEPSPPLTSERRLRAPALVAREAEWALMEAAWARGQVILLVGEAGAGKSRLASDFVASKGRALLFEGRPGDVSVPYATAVRNLRRVLAQPGQPPLEDALRRSLSRVLPELGGELDRGDGADTRLRDAIRTVLQRGVADVSALIFDDLQFSDDASIEVTTLPSAAAFPLGRPGGLPRMVICYRSGQLSPGYEAQLRDLMDAGFAVRIDVGPLGEAGVAALLDSLAVPGDAQEGRRVARLTGGNPAFVLEVARLTPSQEARHATLPPRVEQLMQARLTRLAPVSLSVARAAGVLQSDFTVEQVAELLDMPLLDAAAAWDELERADIIHGERFSHDLMASAVRTGMPPVVRRLLHRGAARLLARGAAPPARIAQHWLDGGDEQQAAPWLVHAGEAARLAFRLQEAAGFLARAADLFTRHGQPELAFDAAVQQLDVRADLGDAGHREAAEALLAAAGTEGQRARAAVQVARALSDLGDSDALEQVAQEGLLNATAAGDLDSEAALQEALAIVALWRCQLDRAPAPLRRMQDIGRQRQSLDWQARAEEGLGLWASYCHLQQAVQHLERAEALNLQRGGRVRAASSADKLARVHFDLGEVHLAQVIHDRAERHLDGLEGSVGEKLVNAHGRVMCLQGLGHPAAALRLGEETLEAYAATHHNALWVLRLQRARSLFLLGAFEAALDQIEETRRAARVPGHLTATRAVEQAEVLTALHRPAEADTCLTEAEARLATLDDVHLRVRLLLTRAALKDPRAATPLLGAALALAEQHGLAGAVLAVQARQAAIMLDLGEAPDLPPVADAHGGIISAEEWHFQRHRALRAQGSPDAAEALQAAWAGLQVACAPLSPDARTVFLTHVPLHRAITEAMRFNLTSSGVRGVEG